MDTIELLSVWVTLTPRERASVRDVYFRDQTVAHTARRRCVSVIEVSQTLQSAYRRVAVAVRQPEPEGKPTAGEAPACLALRGVDELVTGSWRWNTSREEMSWSDSLFEMYGYPVDAVRPTIGVHQSHKHDDDRATVQRLVVTAATRRGTVVVPQRIIRTDGSVVPAVMRVVREHGSDEVLVGEVVADTRRSA